MNIKRRNIFIVCVSLIMVFSVLLISAPGANADALSDYLATHIIGVWPGDRIPVKYTIDNTFSKDEKQAIRNAFAKWQAANSRMEFEFLEDGKGQTLLADPTRELDSSKSSHVVLVTRKPLEEIPQFYLYDKEQGLGSACPSAQSFPFGWWTDNPQQIIGGCIILLPKPRIKVGGKCIRRYWSTSILLQKHIVDSMNKTIDLETAMLHEIGHLIGLNHPEDLESPTIMGSAAVNNIHRELYPADKDAIRRMYPKTVNSKPKNDNIVTFEKGFFTPQQKTAVLEIANAIRSDDYKKMSKYSKNEESAKQILGWWGTFDKVSNIKFRAGKYKYKSKKSIMFLQDAHNGMYTCDVIKDGNRFIIELEHCIFTDGY